MSRSANRVKVLHLLTDGNGAHPYFWTIAAHANRNDFDIVVGTLGPASQLQADMAARGLRTIALGCALRREYPGAVFRLARWLRRENVQVIQTHLPEASLVGLLAARLAGTRVGLFTSHHSHEVVVQPGGRLLLLDQLLGRILAHGVIAHSAWMRDVLIRVDRVNASKVHTIPIGFELDRWRATREQAQEIREELGLGGAFLFGAVGRLHWVKDYSALLHAFAMIATSDDDLALLIVGDGPDREALQALAARMGIDDRVRFVGRRRDIVAVMSAMDVFVHTSRAESFGQVIVEAAALGKPIISTSVGVASDIIQDNKTGFIVPVSDAEALQKAMRASINDFSRLALAAEKNRDRLGAFEGHLMASAFEELYTTLLSDGRALVASPGLLKVDSRRESVSRMTDGERECVQQDP